MRRIGPFRRDAVRELCLTVVAVDKLAARAITVEEVEQLLWNEYVTVRNKRHAWRRRRKLPDRRLMIGNTNGGRTLTIVVERTTDPTTWLVITGWPASADQRKILRG